MHYQNREWVTSEAGKRHAQLGELKGKMYGKQISGYFLHWMFGMLMRFGGSPLSAQAHLTSEFILLSWAFTSPGYNSLHAGRCQPAPLLPRTCPRPCGSSEEAYKDKWALHVARRVAQVQERGACLRQPSDYQRELSKHLQAWPLNFCTLIDLICSPGAK